MSNTRYDIFNRLLHKQQIDRLIEGCEVDVLEGKTKLLVTATKVKGKTHERFLVHVPSKTARDSQSPFEAGDVLKI